MGGTALGVPIRRTVIFWGLYWGPLILGNYYICHTEDQKRSHRCQICLAGGEGLHSWPRV